MTTLLSDLIRRVPTRLLLGALLLATGGGALVVARMTSHPDAAPPAVTRSATTPTPEASPSTADGSASTSPSPTRSPSGDDDDGSPVYTPPSSAPARPAAAAVAAQFARAWVRRDLPGTQWWSGIAPYCEPGLADQLRTADPGRVPAGRITGAPTPVQSRTDFAAFDVPTDAGVLQLGVASLDGAWRVTTLDWRRT
ncbi:hypothetical protein [Krasilnikovia sp. MM14-A1259]|uniref:hypothetical protein n=1 Tax=Krasilnikovia sp. MM14-A1259 TaxID=3373539 RepID=UPI00382F861B